MTSKATENLVKKAEEALENAIGEPGKVYIPGEEAIFLASKISEDEILLDDSITFKKDGISYYLVMKI